MTEWLGIPALAADHGGQIDSLIVWIHVFMFIRSSGEASSSFAWSVSALP